MSYPTDRVQLFDRDMNPLRELAPSEVFSRVRTEEVNGEHALVIVTTRRLEEGWRALTVDGTGKWREWVLTEPDESHESGKTAIGTYRFVWSLQYDLTYSYFHDTEEGVSIGMGSDTLASVAAQHVLEGVAGWSVGPCDAPDIAAGTGCVFIRESAWSKLSKLVECSGVEVDSIIEVSNLYGVTARKLCLRSHVGNEDALLRFDWSRDLTGIRRTPDPGPYYCRVVPLGKGENEYADDDETTYEYPIDITEEPDGQGGFYPYYLQDDEAALAFRIKAGDGTYVYPTIAVTYSEDDPELLLNAALAELHDYTRPGVTYEADVVQLAQAGMDVRGVALGDEVQCVDYGFNPDAGLRIQGRVLKIEVDELSPETTTQLTIGQLRDSITDLMKDMGQSLDELQHNNDKITEQMRSMTTARYIDELLDRINAEINATGGYAYFVPGEGIITYDVAVADPLVGSEATQVVQIKGGSIRIANSKDAQDGGIDDWNWRTVFTANGINADLITTIHAIAGYLGNPTNSNYWNLDTGELVLRMIATLNTIYSGGTRENQVISTKHGIIAGSGTAYPRLTGYFASDAPYDILGLKIERNKLNTDGTEEPRGQILIVPSDVLDSAHFNSVASNGKLHLVGCYGDTTYSSLTLGATYALLTSAQTREVHYDPIGGNAESTWFTSSYVWVSDDGIALWAYPLGNGKTGTKYGGIVIDSEGIHALKATFAPNDTTITGTTNLEGTSNIHKITASSNTGEDHTLVVSDREVYLNNKLYVGMNNDSYGYPGDGTIRCGNITINNDLQASTTVTNRFKSRVVATDYGNKLLYCYETPNPTFGDIGSGTVGSDGLCYVQIDDVFSETARVDYEYQVFLQKYGNGDIWVASKQRNYFVVSGTPNLDFGWEIKARQTGYENTRLEDFDLYVSEGDEMQNTAKMSNDAIDMYDLDYSEKQALVVSNLYENYVDSIERIYATE